MVNLRDRGHVIINDKFGCKVVCLVPFNIRQFVYLSKHIQITVDFSIITIEVWTFDRNVTDRMIKSVNLSPINHAYIDKTKQH